MCKKNEKKEKENHYANLDGDPPLELRASIKEKVRGLITKHDSGNINAWGRIAKVSLTDWIVLGGPVIGFNFLGSNLDLSVIIGDRCRPKYFGAKKLSL